MKRPILESANDNKWLWCVAFHTRNTPVRTILAGDMGELSQHKTERVNIGAKATGFDLERRPFVLMDGGFESLETASDSARACCLCVVTPRALAAPAASRCGRRRLVAGEGRGVGARTVVGPGVCGPRGSSSPRMMTFTPGRPQPRNEMLFRHTCEHTRLCSLDCQHVRARQVGRISSAASPRITTYAALHVNCIPTSAARTAACGSISD